MSAHIVLAIIFLSTAALFAAQTLLHDRWKRCDYCKKRGRH